MSEKLERLMESFNEELSRLNSMVATILLDISRFNSKVIADMSNYMAKNENPKEDEKIQFIQRVASGTSVLLDNVEYIVADFEDEEKFWDSLSDDEKEEIEYNKCQAKRALRFINERPTIRAGKGLLS